MTEKEETDWVTDWEEIESPDDDGSLFREKVPGGWIVAWNSSGESMIFVPDASHEWNPLKVIDEDDEEEEENENGKEEEEEQSPEEHRKSVNETIMAGAIGLIILIVLVLKGIGYI